VKKGTGPPAKEDRSLISNQPTTKAILLGDVYVAKSNPFVVERTEKTIGELARLKSTCWGRTQAAGATIWQGKPCSGLMRTEFVPWGLLGVSRRNREPSNRPGVDDAFAPVVFIGLNPSSADETVDDATIRRCVGFAKAWGYGGLVMLNLFALRSTDPARLRSDWFDGADVIGPGNDSHIITETANRVVIAAWGTHGTLAHRDIAVLEWLRKLGRTVAYLGLNKDATPKHPLYLKKNVTPMSMFQPAAIEG
jgi:hypothetical protein